MKISLTILCLFAPILASFTGCQSAATEQEKQDFSRQVVNNENTTDQEEEDQAIAPGYQDTGAGQDPSWELPAD